VASEFIFMTQVKSTVYMHHLPLVSRISSSRFLICEKSWTIASDRSSRRLSSTSRGFSFAASPSCTEQKHLNQLILHYKPLMCEYMTWSGLFEEHWPHTHCLWVLQCLTSKLHLYVMVEKSSRNTFNNMFWQRHVHPSHMRIIGTWF